MNAALAAAACLIAVAFALSTFDRWQRRGRAHELAWTVSLCWFALGAGALWWAESRGWSLPTFRVFFVAGAVLNVPWLALGTIYLLGGEQAGNRVRGWLVALSGLCVGIVLFAPTKTAVSGRELPTGQDVFDAAPRILAAVGSGISAVIIIAGALWSVARVVRHRSPAYGGASRRVVAFPRRLVAGNLLIALGTLVLSASGTLAGRLGKDRSFAVTLLVGIVVLFLGFLVATTSPRRATAAQPAANVTPIRDAAASR